MFSRTTHVLVQLMILVSLAPQVLSTFQRTQLGTVPEYEPLPDAQAKPFKPSLTTTQPLIQFRPADPPAPYVNPGANRGSWWSRYQWPWTRPTASNAGRPISSNAELTRVLQTGQVLPASAEMPDVPIFTVGDKFPAVELPGNGWDGAVLQQMKMKGRSFFAVGGGGKIWFINPEGRVTEMLGSNKDVVNFAISRARKERIPVPRLLLEHPPVDAVSAISPVRASSWWERLGEGAQGFLKKAGTGFRYLRGP